MMGIKVRKVIVERHKLICTFRLCRSAAAALQQRRRRRQPEKVAHANLKMKEKLRALSAIKGNSVALR